MAGSSTWSWSAQARARWSTLGLGPVLEASSPAGAAPGGFGARFLAPSKLTGSRLLPGSAPRGTAARTTRAGTANNMASRRTQITSRGVVLSPVPTSPPPGDYVSPPSLPPAPPSPPGHRPGGGPSPRPAPCAGRPSTRAGCGRPATWSAWAVAPAACNWCAGTAGSGARYGAECKASAMRYVVFGAGAVGGAIGGRLFEHGHEVVLVARGPHLEALRARGLELRSPDAAVTLPIPAVDGPGRVDFGPDDVVLLATKSQDTAAALDALRAVSREDLPVVCAQNGVDNERMALRSFARVYGMCVMLPASHLEPGVVEVNSSPVTGILDLGRFPSGTDDVARRMAADLEASSFSSRPDPAIMRQKYAKLLMNLGN